MSKKRKHVPITPEMQEALDNAPRDENGYIIISPETQERVDKVMAWIGEHYPNCKELSFEEQDRIIEEGLKALNLI